MSGLWRVRRSTIELLRGLDESGRVDDADETTIRASRLLAAYLREIMGSEPNTMRLVFPDTPADASDYSATTDSIDQSFSRLRLTMYSSGTPGFAQETTTDDEPCDRASALESEPADPAHRGDGGSRSDRGPT